jgi:hypothetical protein
MFQIWMNAGMGVRQTPAANDIKALGGGVHKNLQIAACAALPKRSSEHDYPI